jgi:two-component system, NarL family, invasion response regulator UvrY
VIGPTKILLVDDHAIVREGYRRLLEDETNIRVVGEASNAAQACEQARSLAPDVVVMDIALPGVTGIEATRRMVRDQPQLRVLMFSMYDDAIYARRALEAGALGYLSKASAPEVLVRAIYAVSRGERCVSPDVATNIARSSAQARKADIAALTPREFEVLRLLVQGETVRSISEKLVLSEKTIANHQSAIREKLGVRNSAQLARLASQLDLTSSPMGWTPPPP